MRRKSRCGTADAAIIGYHSAVPMLQIREAAELLGVSDDTIRRWIDDGGLPTGSDQSGRKTVDGAALTTYSRKTAAAAPKDPLSIASSARNRFAGLVTKVVADTVMAQVEMQCGPFTVVSLMSSEAVRELNLEPGSVAVAVVKATTVIVETSGQS
ncbi:TOBE domain-containing protein [Mycolicibacterium pallens]|uniref:TOBE domain-containing protein n=1 Tax=Mycolicibacterium pallens TaxID=370524 RepID=A0ABX8V9X8_9MYCO|nr:TOBE domain-containing protein [Mycolicibacterium pallens]QYL14594.1 TOBE domain-containing protein [Mycolicibacterium pallens]